MNAVEIEEAVSNLALEPFDLNEFPYKFLMTFGEKDTVIKRLKSNKNSFNSSDLDSGVLLRNNIHIVVCAEGQVESTFKQLKQSPQTKKGKVKFILTTDGEDFAAENVNSGEIILCEYIDFANHFGFFLPLAGITTTQEIIDNPIDIKAAGSLNRLYVELLKENKDWDTEDRRHDLNQFMARLIFCYFAEDTGIFPEKDMFTVAIDQMSDGRSENADFVISKIFHAMDVMPEKRSHDDFPNWAINFPYVNGGLFAGNRTVPKVSRMARSYLINAGNLNWKEINPDIFGSMIQAVADDEERGAIGLHYTSIPNMLKVLNPLFLDDLRGSLEKAGNNPRKLLNLRKRISKIRVFDPACGSGNFLVIAYKEMRQIEADINNRRDESHLKSEIPLSNFRGIELREFATEIARLSLIIAEYQCDELFRGQKDALADFLPLDSKNWIVHGNALRIDWLSVCPPTEKSVEHFADDFFHKPEDQAQIDFKNEGGETYICGNPPFSGKGRKNDEILEDMKHTFSPLAKSFGYADLASCWLVRASQYIERSSGFAAFVSTNSICQGQQVPQIWPCILNENIEIEFAYLSFKWTNNARNNAGVMCVIICIGNKYLRSGGKFISDGFTKRNVPYISPYLVPSKSGYVQRRSTCLSKSLTAMTTGSVLNDGGNLLFSQSQYKRFISKWPEAGKYIIKILGAAEFLRGQERFCLKIKDNLLEAAVENPEIAQRLSGVADARRSSKKSNTREILSLHPNRFEYESGQHANTSILIPTVSSGNRNWLPVAYLSQTAVIAPNYAIYDSPRFNFSILSSRLHIVWIGTICGKLKSDYRYNNSLGWNTFPVPTLTKKNKLDLTRCAEDILLAREQHFPATIADLYSPEKMPENLRQAHDKNDETLERIYIGRRFNNDTERLEKLFELYTKMTSSTTLKKNMENHQ